MKSKDNSRPITYERAELDWNTDIVEIMYPSVDYIAQYGRHSQKRPYIIAEYCHAMGNSLGGLSDYWDTIDKYPQLQGGFIWDWVDQSIITRDSLGRTYYAVGGDLGELPGIGDDDLTSCATCCSSRGRPARGMGCRCSLLRAWICVCSQCSERSSRRAMAWISHSSNGSISSSTAIRPLAVRQRASVRSSSGSASCSQTPLSGSSRV